MAITIKNVILYDAWQHVSGFVELKTGTGGTSIKIRNNLHEKDLLLSLVAGTQSHVLNLHDKNQVFDVDDVINLDEEVVVCIMKKDGNKVTTLASGALNLVADMRGDMGARAGAEDTFSQMSQDASQDYGKTFVLADNLDLRGDISSKAPTAPARTRTDLGEESVLRGEQVVTSESSVSVILGDTEMPISRKLADSEPRYKTEAAREIDELLRAVCSVDDEGKGICENCPYREHFFGENFDSPASSKSLTIN